MIKKYRLSLILGSVVTLLPLFAGLLLWNRLPDAIPIHWGISGTADVMAGPWVVVLLLPIILLALQWICVWLTCRDPGMREQNPKMIQITFWIIPIISLFCNGIIYASAFGNGLQIFRFIPLFLALLFIVLGNYMPKITPNSHLGIKTSWTFYTEENWHATHRFCGKVWVICGFLSVFGVFLPEKWIIVALIVPIIPVAVCALVYPYWYYRKQVKNGLTPISKKARTKKSRWIMIGLIIALIILAAVLGHFLFTGEIQYHLGESELVIEADYWTDLTVHYSIIESMEYLEQADHGSRSMGYGSPRLSVGSFRNEEYGDFTLYAYTKCPTAILIDTEKGTLMLSADTAEETLALYERLKELIE